MPFLHNSWYCAAWSEEIARSLLQRTILNESVLLFRQTDGTVKAIGNLCPHKLAPLNLGELVGDSVQCGYHGLQFDGSGRCTHNPYRREPDTKAKLKTYPVHEQDSIAWIWMGNGTPDLNKIPCHDHLSSATRRTIRGNERMDASYRLMLDNLMDLSHAQFLHKVMASPDAFDGPRNQVRQQGDSVFSTFRYPLGKAQYLFRRHLPDPDADVTQELTSRWDPASSIFNEISVFLGDQPPFTTIGTRGSHIITPSTDTSCWYFFAASRNYALDDAAVDEEFRTWQATAIRGQDVPMVEAIQRAPSEFAVLPSRIAISADAGGTLTSRLLDRMIEAEQGALDPQDALASV